MKFSGLENIDAGVRSSIVISVAAAYFAFDIGFDIGVYGRIFYDTVFLIWSVSLALLMIVTIIPKETLPVPRSLWVATAIPTLWVLVGLANRAAPNEVLFRHSLNGPGTLRMRASSPVKLTAISQDWKNGDFAVP